MATRIARIHLKSSETKQLIQIAGEANDIASADEFRNWTQSSVRKLLPHEALIAGVARREGEKVSVERLVSAGFPLAFIEAVRQRRGSFACPTLEAWFIQGRPQLFDPGRKPVSDTANHASQEFEAHELKNVAAHGVLASSGDTATYFSFSRIPHALSERDAVLLELIAPHLHQAYMRAMAKSKIGYAAAHQPPARALPRLTPRERSVLHQLYLDGPTRTAAQALGRSEHTVKNQIRGVLRKLGASNRSEAVSTAIRLGLLRDRRCPNEVSPPSAESVQFA